MKIGPNISATMAESFDLECRMDGMRKEAADGVADRLRLREDLAEAKERIRAEEDAQVSNSQPLCCVLFFSPSLTLVSVFLGQACVWSQKMAVSRIICLRYVQALSQPMVCS